MTPRPKVGLRWALAGAAAVLAHGCAAFILFGEPPPADPDAGSPAAFIELAPVAVALESKPEDIAPGPPQPESEKRDQIDAQEQQKPDPTPPLPLPPAPEPDQAQPPPKPAPAESGQQAPQDESTATAPPEAAEHADHAAAPAAGRAAQKPSAADLRWERRIVMRLERAKRYPHGASGRSGVAKVMFRIDRDGHLVTSKIVESSGIAVFDAATLDLLKRAEPFPTPPQDLADNQLVFVAPIHYLASASSR